MSSVQDSREDLFERLTQALDQGRVSEADVERLVARGRPRGARARPTAASVLYALGAVVVFAGLAIGYGTVFTDLPWLLQITTPLLFPAVALVTCVGLAKRRAVAWQVDVAGLVGYTSLAGALAVIGAASGWINTGREAAAFIAIGAIVAILVVLGLYAGVRSFRLAGVGLPLALAVLGASTAWAVSLVGTDGLCWVLLAEAGIAAVTAVVLADRSRRAAYCASVWAVLISYASLYAAVASGFYDFGHLTVWHGILGATVVAAFLVSGTFDFKALIWLGAAGGALWLVMIAVVVGSATNAAAAVILVGFGLVMLGLLVTKLRRSQALSP